MYRPAVAAVGFALLWAVLAALSPTTTFHLAPAIVAGAGPLVGRRDARWASAVASLAVALAATVLLAAAQTLRGPALLGGPMLEPVLLASLGALVSAVVAGRTRVGAT